MGFAESPGTAVLPTWCTARMRSPSVESGAAPIKKIVRAMPKAMRSKDVRDVGQRLIRNLMAKPYRALTELTAGTVVVADELTPAEEDNLEEKLSALQKEQERHWKKLARSVDVYGAINLRTDGEKIVMAQKLEKKRGNDEWDIYRIEQDDSGEFHYLSKYENH